MNHSRLVMSAFMLVASGQVLVAATGCGKSPGLTEASTVGGQSHGANAQPPTAAKKPVEGTGGGMSAMREASTAGKYLFAFFWKQDDEQTRTMRNVFDGFLEKVVDRAQSVAVDMNDISEKAIIDRFDLARAPMPLVLAIAPNGAVMAGFPTKFTAKELLNAFGSPCTERCMKAIQEKKLVLLCVQNTATKFNAEAMQGVREFKADERFASATEIVMLDPTNAAEGSFLADLKIDPRTPEAVTAFLAPPGSAIAEFRGATSKAEFVAALEKANSVCCPGGACGPNGCGAKQ